MSTITRDRIEVLIERGMVWYVSASNPSLVSGATHNVGFTTGSNEVVFLDRSYLSTGSQIFVGLYEASFTGGVSLTAVNRRLAITASPPFVMRSGVTATLGTPITSVTILAPTSTGSAQAGITTEASRYILKASTSYVVGIRNDAAGTAAVGGAFNFHEMRFVPTWTEH